MKIHLFDQTLDVNYKYKKDISSYYGGTGTRLITDIDFTIKDVPFQRNNDGHIVCSMTAAEFFDQLESFSYYDYTRYANPVEQLTISKFLMNLLGFQDNVFFRIGIIHPAFWGDYFYPNTIGYNVTKN